VEQLYEAREFTDKLLCSTLCILTRMKKCTGEWSYMKREFTDKKANVFKIKLQ
jgi:hypothetical protein